MKQLQDFYRAMETALKQGPLLVWYLDGFGYEMYLRAASGGYLSWLGVQAAVEAAESVNPPLTNPALATILTGLLPEEHGVKDRSCRMLSAITIFQRTDVRSIWLEGDSVLLKTDIRPLLHTRQGGFGCDYWICRSVEREIQAGCGFVLAHLHEIDDCAHTCGPYSSKTMSQIAWTDREIGKISCSFPGTVLVISDHGLYPYGKGGDHGENRREDRMIIWGEYQNN